jgi:2-polyprenyl-3-methyl-5-hydroxy-6-metoxy-1,4-benzoquinol methylase
LTSACGDGFVGESLRLMLDAHLLVGVDVHLSDTACGVSQGSDHVIERYSSDHLVGERRFDLVLALDVIEHVADDRALLGDVVSRWTTRGGLVLVTVPAFQALFSDHDRALRHYRRYNVAQLQTTLTAAGLQTLDAGYFFASLLAPRTLATVRETDGSAPGRPWRGVVAGDHRGWRGSSPPR